MANIRTVVKKLIPTNLFKTIEPYGHLLEAVAANVRYGFPSRGMHVIGVTGTNGKTTTSSLIQRMLHEAGYKTALLSTVQYGIGLDIVPEPQHMTTASAPLLQRRLRDFKRAGVEWVVVETSSHALAQHRIWGIPYEIAVMTNVTGDHLDYHGTFANYLEAKRQLFVIVARNHGLGIINADDANVDKFTSTIKNHLTYGIKGGDLKASKIEMKTDHTTYLAAIGNDQYDVRVNIPGEFNVSNSLAAVAAGRAIGLTKSQVEKGIAATKSVEGRMMAINEGQKFGAIVDFASTPDAFERFFETVRPTTKGKLVVVFGSAGRRDEEKRATQGAIAAKYADELIITEEDDRDVDGSEIMNQIADGAAGGGKVEGKDMFLILDREEAIGFALTRVSKPGDLVAFLGKGHEKTIERADGVYPWNEPEIVREAIKNLLAEKPKKK